MSSKSRERRLREGETYKRAHVGRKDSARWARLRKAGSWGQGIPMCRLYCYKIKTETSETRRPYKGRRPSHRKAVIMRHDEQGAVCRQKIGAEKGRKWSKAFLKKKKFALREGAVLICHVTQNSLTRRNRQRKCQQKRVHLKQRNATCPGAGRSEK